MKKKNKLRRNCKNIELNEEKKQIEKELQKYRIELKNFRNTQTKKGLNNKSNNNDKENDNIIDNDKIKDYEEQINKLIEENTEYKNHLEQIEKTQIIEYQKLLDDSFSKIALLNKELIDSKDKNKYLEKALNIVEQTARKNNLNLSSFNNKENEYINNNKEFLNKKRKMPKMYQDIIDNQQNNKNSDKATNLQTPNEEKNNMAAMEFSNFEI